MSRSPAEYLRHILEEIDYLTEKSAGVSREEFLADETLQRAFVRSLEIIGAATKNLPQVFREKHDAVNWRAMAGMRDKLIHGYFGVDYDLVWDAVVNKIPDLRDAIQALIEKGDV